MVDNGLVKASNETIDFQQLKLHTKLEVRFLLSKSRSSSFDHA